MKIPVFLLGIVFSIFFISTQNVYSMKRKHNGKKSQETERLLSEQTQEEDFDSALQATSEYIRKIKSIQIRMFFIKAENLFSTNEFEAALPIYETIINKSNDPLALFRLGQIYEKKAEEDPVFLTKSYDHYKLALINGFEAALPKLLEIGETLNQILKDTQSKPMSFEVQQIYL